MYTDIPVFRRCCFCVPLRPGLIAWGYIKMATNLLFLGCVSYFLHLLSVFIWVTGTSILLLCSIIFFILLDLTFVGIFLVSAHKKKHKVMKIYYKYCLAMLVLRVFCLLVLLFYIAVVTAHLPTRNIEDFIFMFVGVIISMLFEMILLVYMILLVRSEVIKLKSSSESLDMAICEQYNTKTVKETHTAFCNRLANDPEHTIVQH